VLNLDFANPAINADPFPMFSRLREEDPVHWSPEMKAWVVTRYNVVRQFAVAITELSAYRLAPFFAAVPTDSLGSYANLMTYLGNWMVFQDPPDHTRLRRLFTKAFTSRSVKALEPNIEQIVGLLLDEMDEKSRLTGTVDWIADFAYPLPATVMMDLLGVPRDDLMRVKEWSDDIALFIGTARATADKYQRAEAGARAMAEYFRGILAQRAADPQDDIISQLVSERNERLTDDEIIATCILLLFAGHETTTNLIGNGLYYTMKFPDQWARLREDPALVDPAIEEWLRYDGPSGALARVITADIEFGGKQLMAGQRLFAFVNAANRDPRQFTNADRFDIGRTPNTHLTFGHGIQFCLGASLARLEGQIALRALIERFPNISLATDDAPLWRDSVILRGMESLSLRLR
jgi:cytochrome P450